MAALMRGFPSKVTFTRPIFLVHSRLCRERARDWHLDLASTCRITHRKRARDYSGGVFHAPRGG